MPDKPELSTSTPPLEAELEEDLMIPAEVSDPSTFERFKTAASNMVKIVAHGDAIEAIREAANHL